MAARPQLPGMRWFQWLRIKSLRIGIVTGIYLSGVFVAWLIVANRITALYPFAGVRNAVTAAVILVLLAIPVLRFRHTPGRLFVAGLSAWTVLTMTFVAAGLYFTLLPSRMGAFHLFTLGAVSYGFLAVLDWVFLMCAGVRHQHMLHSGQVAEPVRRQHPQ
jgi:hypothetical protein